MVLFLFPSSQLIPRCVKALIQLFYFHWVNVQNAEKFPISYNELPPTKTTYTLSTDWAVVYDFDNLRDYFQFLEKQKVTHLILDKYGNAQWHHELSLNLLDIFNHENKYPFLVKEYDSKENGFNYHIKLFKIDYKMLEATLLDNDKKFIDNIINNKGLINFKQVKFLNSNKAYEFNCLGLTIINA